MSGEEEDADEKQPSMKKPTIQIKKPSKREKKEKQKEVIRRKMRENFRTLQLEEGVSKARGGMMDCQEEKEMDNETGVEVMEDLGEGLDDETRRAKAELYKDQGNAFFRNKHDLKSAITAYTTAISFDKSNFIYYNNRAAAFLLAGEYTKAVADCDASLALKEDNIKAYTRKASALSELRKFDPALACIAKALALDPNHRETLHVQEGLLTLKVESLQANITSLSGQLHPDADITTLIPTTEKKTPFPRRDPATPVSVSVSVTSTPPRPVPKDKIRLSPLTIAGTHTLTKKLQ